MVVQTRRVETEESSEDPSEKHLSVRLWTPSNPQTQNGNGCESIVADRKKSVRRFWLANGALLVLGLVLLTVGIVSMFVAAKKSKSTSVPPCPPPTKTVARDLAVACGVICVMFVLQNAILAAFHTGMPFHRHPELSEPK